MGKIIVYHKAYKFGFVSLKESNERRLEIDFFNGKKTIANTGDINKNPYLKTLNDNFEDFIMVKTYKYFFSNGSIEKSNNLIVIKDSIEIVSSNEIKGQVTSFSKNETFNVSLKFDGKGKFTSICDCKEGVFCEHAYRLLEFISEFANNVDEEEIFKNNDFQKLINPRKDVSYFFRNIDSFNNLKKEFEGLMKEDYLTRVFSRINDSEYFTLAYYLNMYGEKHCPTLIYKVRDNCGISPNRFYLSNSSYIINRLNKYTEEGFNIVIILLFRDDYDGLISLLLDELLFEMYTHDALVKLINLSTELDKITIDKLVKFMANRYQPTKELANATSRYLSVGQKLKINSFNTGLFKIDSTNFTYEQFIDAFSSLDDETKIKMFNKYRLEISKNEKIIIDAIFIELYNANNFRDYNATFSIFKALSSSPYYALFLLDKCNSRSLRKDHKRELFELHKKANFTKFNEYYYFELDNENIEGNKNVMSLEDIPYFLNSYYIKIYKEGKFKAFYEDKYFCHCYNNSIVDDFELSMNQAIIKGLKEDRDRVTEELQKIIKEKEILKKREEMLDFFSSLKKENQQKIMDLVHPIITNQIQVGIENNEPNIRIITNDKSYKVKNIEDFIKAIKGELEYSINYKVTIDCHRSFFDEKSNRIIDILLEELNFVFDYYHTTCSISKKGISRVLLEQGGLYFDKLFFKYIDEEIEVKFLINKDKIIKMEPLINEEDIIEGECIYLISKSLKVIRPIKGRNNVTPVFKFFKYFNSCDIKDNELGFKENIYKGNEEYIEIEDDLTLQNLNKDEIEVYIDFEKDVLVKKTKIIKDGNEISLEESTNETKQNIKLLDHLFYKFNFNDDKLVDDDDIYRFLTTDLSSLKSICTLYFASSLNPNIFRPLEKMNLRVNYGTNMVEAFFNETSFSDEELEKIYNAIKKKKKFIQLTKDKIISLNNDNAKEFVRIADSLQLDKKRLSSPQEKSTYHAFKIVDAIGEKETKEKIIQIMDDIQDFKNNKVDINCVNAELKDYQVDGVNWMASLVKHNLAGILADDMGLGKTLQTITLLKNHPINKPVLIVCPKSLIFNWYNEFLKFDPSSKVIKIHGNNLERNQIIKNIKEDERVIYISSYDSLRNDLSHYKCEFEFLILDEAQAIKTVNTKKAQSVKQIKAKHRFGLTGTPIENNIFELWSIFDFLMPGYFENLDEFRRKYENDGEFKEEIANRISLFVLRRTKKEVLKDLPLKTERVLEAEMTTEQRKIYDSFCYNAQKQLKEGGKVFDILPLLMRLRQICVDPNLFVENYNGDSGKMNLLKDTILDLIKNNHKCLIFSQFVKALDLIEEFLKENNIKYYKIIGDTKAEERVNLCDKFNQDDTHIFLISLKAGGNGLNLVGADTVIHIDPWWNSAVQDQATDRAYRIGQTKNVDVIKIICENTIEERVIELQNMKKDLIDSLIASSEEGIMKLSHDDIKFLLN